MKDIFIRIVCLSERGTTKLAALSTPHDILAMAEL
jgi:hypothetical protein